MMQISGSVLYAISALAITVGGIVWVWDWKRFRRLGTERPAELSPMDPTALGLLAAAAIGAFAVAVGTGTTTDWLSLLFAAAVVALSTRCLMFLFQRRAIEPKQWFFVVAATLAGAILAAAG
jgi:RsiW-degrading membrane proteinase PrsW (M82 family)